MSSCPATWLLYSVFVFLGLFLGCERSGCAEPGEQLGRTRLKDMHEISFLPPTRLVFPDTSRHHCPAIPFCTGVGA